jgi:hypothetical protein
MLNVRMSKGEENNPERYPTTSLEMSYIYTHKGNAIWWHMYKSQPNGSVLIGLSILPVIQYIILPYLHLSR